MAWDGISLCCYSPKTLSPLPPPTWRTTRPPRSMPAPTSSRAQKSWSADVVIHLPPSPHWRKEMIMSLRTININMLFDLQNLGFPVRRVTLSYLDLGGYENLAVNASGIYRGQIAAAPAFLGNANVSVTSAATPPPVSGRTGTVTITGPLIKSFLIGGQEFWID